MAWTKICLKVTSEREIQHIYDQAHKVGVNTYLFERDIIHRQRKKQAKSEPAEGKPAQQTTEPTGETGEPKPAASEVTETNAAAEEEKKAPENVEKEPEA